MVFLARRALQERFTSKGREATAGQGIEVGSWVCVLNGRHFPLFSAGDRGEVVRVDKEALNCDVLFDGAEQPVPVALRHLQIASRSHSENASAKMVAALRSSMSNGGTQSSAAPVATWQIEEEVDEEVPVHEVYQGFDVAKDFGSIVGAQVKAGVKSYETNGCGEDCYCFANGADDAAGCGCGNCYQASSQFASDASIVINRSAMEVNDRQSISSLDSLQAPGVLLSDQNEHVPESSPSVNHHLESSFSRAEPSDAVKPQAMTTCPTSTKEERAAKLADMLAAMDITGMKFNGGSATNGIARTCSLPQYSDSAATACSSARASSGVPDFGSIDSTVFTFSDPVEGAALQPDVAPSSAASDVCTISGEEQVRALVAEDRCDKVEALESRLTLLEERHRQEVASLRNALELALAFGREQEARASALEKRLSEQAFCAAVGPAISGSPPGSVTAPAASAMTSPNVGLGSSPLMSMVPPTPLTLPAVPVTPLGPPMMEAAFEAALTAPELESATVPSLAGGSLAARLSPGPPLAASLPDGVARTLLLASTCPASDEESAIAGGNMVTLTGSIVPLGSAGLLLGNAAGRVGSTGSLSSMGSRGGSAAAPIGSPTRLGGGSANAPAGGLASLGGSSAVPVGSMGSLSSRGPNSARSCEGFPGPPRRSCSLTVPSAFSARGGQSSSTTLGGSVRRMTSSPSSSGLPGQHGPSTPGRARPVAVEVLIAGPSITSTPSRTAGTGANRRALSASAPCRRPLHRQSSPGPAGTSSSLTAQYRGSSLTLPTSTSHPLAEPEDGPTCFDVALGGAVGSMAGMSLPDAPCSSLLSGGGPARGAAVLSAADISAAAHLNMAYALPGGGRASLEGYGGLPSMPSFVSTADMG